MNIEVIVHCTLMKFQKNVVDKNKTIVPKISIKTFVGSAIRFEIP